LWSHFLLHGREEQAVEIAVTRFDFSRELPPIRLGPPMSEGDDDRGDNAQRGDDRQRE
jgi:hypothetical protein